MPIFDENEFEEVRWTSKKMCKTAVEVWNTEDE
jgi:hypothetical protein